MSKVFSLLFFSSLVVFSNFSWADSFYTIQKTNDSYLFFECENISESGNIMSSCKPFDGLSHEEMASFYVHFEEGVDDALYYKKRNRIVGTTIVVGGTILLMLTPPGQALLFASLGSSTVTASGVGVAGVVGGVLVEAAVTVVLPPLLAGGVAYWGVGKHADWVNETLDAKSGDTLVDGLKLVFEKSEVLVIEKSIIVGEALTKTKRGSTKGSSLDFKDSASLLPPQ